MIANDGLHLIDMLLNKKEEKKEEKEKEKEKDRMKRGYTLSDDENILELVRKFESEKIEPNWEYIGARINRTGRQVKEHYDHIMSNVRVIWTVYEIQVALMIEFIYGRNFKLLIENIPNKSWYHICRKLNDAKYLLRNKEFSIRFKRERKTDEYLPYLDGQLIFQLLQI